MNKADPNKVVDRFVASTTSSLADWKAIDLALTDSGVQLRRRAASQSFMALASTWEVFLSDWLVAAVNRDVEPALDYLTKRITTYATTELGVPAGQVATPISRSHLAVKDVRRLLDPNEFNVVIRSRDELKDFAERWLADPYRAACLGVTNFHFRPALVTRLVRNALAHRSPASMTEANRVTALTTTQLSLRHTGARKLDLAGWGRYIFTTTGTPRIEHFHSELEDLALRFKVP